MKVKDLKINPSNPQRFDDLLKLENSIRDFPKMMKIRPMVYDPKTMMVLGGNKRLLAIQNLGLKEIPDDWVRPADELTEEEKKRFIVADNVGFGTWDWEILESDYEKEKLEEWGVEIINEDIEDIVELPKIVTTFNINIKCDTLEEVEELKNKLGITASSISYENILKLLK